MRPRVQRRDLTAVLQLLNSKEDDHEGRWKTDNREMTSAVKFLDSAGTLAASRLEPHEVAEVLTSAFSVVAISA